jgi:MFS family permease
VVAAGLLGQGIGFAAINSPNANAAAAVLSRAESGVGLGIYQMLFFLGAGFGPAIGATFLALRQNAGAGALNPLYAADAVAYSDAFLLLAVAALISLIASSGLRGKTRRAARTCRKGRRNRRESGRRIGKRATVDDKILSIAPRGNRTVDGFGEEPKPVVAGWIVPAGVRRDRRARV